VLLRDGYLLFFFVPISHNRAKKGNTMLSFFIFLGMAAIVAAAGAVHVVRQTLASLPRSNRDWIFY
jgi:hypothetical protein